MATTLLVEPDPGGHRFQAVANVASVASRSGDVLLLTSAGAVDEPTYAEHLADAPVSVEAPFLEIYPPTAEMLREIVAVCRTREVSTVVVMDADQSLKRWWYLAPAQLRQLPRRPRVVFMITRYPAKLRLSDWTGWKIRVPKALLTIAAMLTGSLDHAAGFAGRDDLSRGWIIRRTRDPEICSAHSRDRSRHRRELDLPPDRRLVGIFGVISERKHADMIWEALQQRGLEADLVLAGGLTDGVAAWAARVEPTSLGRLIVRNEFLSNGALDQYVAAVDVVPLAITLNGPSGIMGKALAAEVPVVTAGSEVRARELVACDGGELAELDAGSIGAAIQRVFDRDPSRPRRNTVPPATAEEFAEKLLGVDADGQVADSTTWRRRKARSAMSQR